MDQENKSFRKAIISILAMIVVVIILLVAAPFIDKQSTSSLLAVIGMFIFGAWVVCKLNKLPAEPSECHSNIRYKVATDYKEMVEREKLEEIEYLNKLKNKIK